MLPARFRRKYIPSVAVAALLASLLLPDTAPAAWRLDFDGGAAIPISRVELNGSAQSSTAVDTGGAYAIGGAYGLGDWFEVNGQFQQTFMGLFVLFGNSLDTYSFTGGGRVFLMPPGRVRPWLTTQIGWYRANASASGFGTEVPRTDNSFGLNTGGGLDVKVNDRVSLGLDVRYNNAFQALDGLQFVTSMFNVGLHFGG